MSVIPQIGGHDQVVMNVPSQVELDAAAEVKSSFINTSSGVKEIPAIGAVIVDPLGDTKIIRLSKNMKLRMAYAGVVEKEQEWKTAPSYEEVTANSSTVWMYVDKDNRTLTALAGDDGIVVTDNGTFTDGIYNNNASTSSTNDGGVGPLYPALAADAAANEGILDMPGRTGGAAMTGENYLNLPGYTVVTSETGMGALDKVLAYVGDCTTSFGGPPLIDAAARNLFLADFVTAGIPANTLVLAYADEYVTALNNASTATVYDIATLQQLIVTTNLAQP